MSKGQKIYVSVLSRTFHKLSWCSHKWASNYVTWIFYVAEKQNKNL